MVHMFVRTKVFPLLGVLLLAMNYGCNLTTGMTDSQSMLAADMTSNSSTTPTSGYSFNINCNINYSCVNVTCNATNVSPLRLFEFKLNTINIVTVQHAAKNNLTVKINNNSGVSNVTLTLVGNDSVNLSTTKSHLYNQTEFPSHYEVFVRLTICQNLTGNIYCGKKRDHDIVGIGMCNSNTDSPTMLISDSTSLPVTNVSRANSTENLVGVKAAGVTFFVIGVLILVIGNVTEILMWLFRRKLHKFMLPSSHMRGIILKVTIGYSLFPILLAIISLLLWIMAASIGSSGVYIGATIISLFLLIASIILVAVLGLIFAWTCKNQPESSMAENEMEIVQESSAIKVNFGTSKPAEKPQREDCNTCKKPFTDEKASNAIMKFFFSQKENEQIKCGACDEGMCKDCQKTAFMKYCNAWKGVCGNCYDEYKKEKEELKELPEFGDAVPAKQPFNNIKCAECLIEPESDEVKLKVSCCMGCGKWVCDDCIVQDDGVPLKYCGSKQEVCRNCYAVYNITMVNRDEEPTGKETRVNGSAAINSNTSDEPPKDEVERKSRRSNTVL